MRLMGMKSLGHDASSFLGIKVMKAEFRSQKFLKSLLQTVEIALMIPPFIICQQFL
jgi:hypothetical protein